MEQPESYYGESGHRGEGPTQTPNDELPFRLATFGDLSETLDYAAQGRTGLNFYDSLEGLSHRLSYAELRKRARRLGRRLLGLGLSRGDRVAVVAEMHPDFVIGFFACQYAGFLAVPLPAPMGLGSRNGYQEQLRRVLRSSEARVVLGPEGLREPLTAAAEDLPVERIASVAALSELSASARNLRPLGPDEPSHVQYSSGSTRQPFGIVISQGALMANARSVAQDALRLVPGDRAASWLPFYHDMGLIGLLVIPLACQISVDYLRPDGFARRPLRWLQLISENRCTIGFSPTFGYELCARRAYLAEELGLDLSHWRVAGIGGEMIRPDILDGFAANFARYGFRPESFVPSYGLAEATLAVSFAPLGEGIAVDRVNKTVLGAEGVAVPARTNGGNGKNGNGHDHPGADARTFATCGRPMPGYRIEVRDDRGTRLPDRHVGHVWVSGPSLMAGACGEPEEARNAVDETGWLDTGDMGYLVDGTLFVTGRRKDIINVRGRNIWPQDLEWYVEQNVGELGTNSTAAFAVEDADGTEQTVVLVQCRLQDAEDRGRLRKAVHSVLSRHAGVDCRVMLVPPGSLPFTTSGKLSRSKARAAYLDGDFEEFEQGAPREFDVHGGANGRRPSAES